MPLPPHPPLLQRVLQEVPRRYRLQALPQVVLPSMPPSAALAATIDQARLALERAEVPGDTVRRLFIDSLAQLIRGAMQLEGGDPAYQAGVLTRSAPRVQEYIALQTHRESDLRMVRAGANAVAHPAKRQHCAAGPLSDALARLHTHAGGGEWEQLALAARQLLPLASDEGKALLQRDLARLLDSDALARLQRATALEHDTQVQAYQALRERQGPRPGSPEAAAYGDTAQRRGAAMEALATQALQALARWLNTAREAGPSYRVVTSMRVPSSIPGNAERAKSEWDAVLLQQASPAEGEGAQPRWDLCLLLEAKASVDAATADFSRLQRGMRLLASADPGAAYSFASREGDVLLRGAALSALSTLSDSDLASRVLYCTDAPAPPEPHLLSAASRMQLLSAPHSMAFATTLARGGDADAQDLQGVWQQLLQSPEWVPVLQQYPGLQRVRALMVHVDDLSGAVPP